MTTTHINTSISDVIRNDQEYKSGIVRAAIGMFVTVYIGIGTATDIFSLSLGNYSVLLGSFMLYSMLVLIHIIRYPGLIPRRYLVTFIDIVFVTVASLFVGKSDSPLYLLYILIFISQGGRFGRPYLFVAAGTSVISYSIVCFVDENFADHSLESIFKAIALIVLPIYLDAMLRTIQRARLDADAANRSKSRFLATMSHEIRTPMSGAIGMINLLKTTPLNNEQRLYVDGLSTSTTRLHLLINDVLDFSKIEAGKITLENRAYSLKDSLQEVTTVLGSGAKQQGIEFNYYIDDSVPDTLYGDPFRLSQILLNLAGNAIKFTEKGKVEIKASVINNDQLLRIEVIDTGIGISMEQLNTIFDGFTQADSSTTRRFGGTGLGTTISRELVTLMKGKIGVDSTVGKGSNFWFELPINKPGKELMDKQAGNFGLLPDSDFAAQTLPTMNILLAEDSEINTLFMTTTLSNAGHKVDAVITGLEALEKLQENKYDIVFMDIHMPEMDGITATKEWRAQEPEDRKTPIIALTANVLEEDRIKCLQAGINEFITKPISPERLNEILSIYVKK